MATRLIINADDFGWSRGITDGIIRAHREGIVTSTTLMASQAASEYALEQAAQNPSLGVGVHLYLCDGRPVLPPASVPTLAQEDGRFHPIAELRRRLRSGQIGAAQIEREFRAQIRWMKDRGVTPTHADSHHHVHFHPRVVFAFARALRAEGIGRARGPRQRQWPGCGGIAPDHAGSLPRRLAIRFYLDLLQKLVFRGLAVPDCRLALAPRYRDQLDLLESGLTAAFQQILSGTYEFESHPGLSQPGFSETDRLRERREAELRVLTSASLREVLRQREIQLISYARL